MTRRAAAPSGDGLVPDGNEESPNILEARGITKVFGGLVAVNSVDFDIPERSIVSLIGPNGAGKTTFFNMVSGLYEVSSGNFTFLGRDVTRYGAHRRAQMGIGRTFQNIRLFGTMSALDNVLAGMHTRLKGQHPRRHLCHAGNAARGARSPREGRGAAGLRRHPGTGGVRKEPVVRGPAETGDRAGPGLRAEAPPSGRADGRDEPAGDGASYGAHREITRRSGG